MFWKKKKKKNSQFFFFKVLDSLFLLLFFKWTKKLLRPNKVMTHFMPKLQMDHRFWMLLTIDHPILKTRH